MIIDRPVYGLLRRRSITKWSMIVLVPNSSFIIWIYCTDCPKFCFHFKPHSRTIDFKSLFAFSYLMPITPRHLAGFTVDSHVHLYPHAFSKLNHSGFAFVQFEEPSQDIKLKMGAYKYMSELYRKMQSDVIMRYLLRIRCWQCRQLAKVYCVPRSIRQGQASRLQEQARLCHLPHCQESRRP